MSRLVNMAEDPEDSGEQFSRDDNPSQLPAFALGDPLVALLVSAWLVPGVDGRLDENPAQPARALLGDVAGVNAAAALVDAGREAGVGHQVLRVGKALDVANLRQDEQRGIVANARECAQVPHDGGRVGLLIDRSGRFLNLSAEGVEDCQEALKRLLIHRAELQRPEPCAALRAEHIGAGAMVPVSPCLSRIACTRFLSMVCSLTSAAR